MVLTSFELRRLLAAVAGIDLRSMEKWASGERVTARIEKIILNALDELRFVRTPPDLRSPLGELGRLARTTRTSLKPTAASRRRQAGRLTRKNAANAQGAKTRHARHSTKPMSR